MLFRSVLNGPEIVTRGWVYAPEAEDLLDEACDRIADAVEAALAAGTRNIDSLEREVRRAADALEFPDDYRTEINLTSRALVASLARLLTRGVMLFIDYGFPAREFYHPQRNQGSLMCHYRHHAHDDPFAFVGLQDITTHVDFSAVAAAAHTGGAALLGYASQAHFLINCGITELLARVGPGDTANYLPLTNQANRLLSPAEMGELFKAMSGASFGRSSACTRPNSHRSADCHTPNKPLAAASSTASA